MPITIGMRDLVRDSSVLSKHDLIDIEDKRTHQYKGVFVSSEYAQKTKEFVQRTIKAEKQKKLDEIMSMAGTLSIHKRFDNLSSSEIRKKIAQEKYGEPK